MQILLFQSLPEFTTNANRESEKLANIWVTGGSYKMVNKGYIMPVGISPIKKSPHVSFA